MPDFLARSLEHIMCVPWFWLDQHQSDVVDATRHLLVEQAYRTHALEPSAVEAGDRGGDGAGYIERQSGHSSLNPQTPAKIPSI